MIPLIFCPPPPFHIHIYIYDFLKVYLKVSIINDKIYVKVTNGNAI